MQLWMRWEAAAQHPAKASPEIILAPTARNWWQFFYCFIFISAALAVCQNALGILRPNACKWSLHIFSILFILCDTTEKCLLIIILDVISFCITLHVHVHDSYAVLAHACCISRPGLSHTLWASFGYTVHSYMTLGPHMVKAPVSSSKFK